MTDHSYLLLKKSDKFKQFGFADSKLHVSNLCYDISIIDTFIKENKITDVTLSNSTRNEEYILYVGRLENVKGIGTLIRAIKNTELQLKIVGSGAAEETFRDIVQNENINNIEFLGFQDKNSVFKLTLNSKFIVCPSEWYENYPFSIIESFLFSKPVVGAKIGGIPELVVHDQTGYLFEHGNEVDLRDKLIQLWRNGKLINEMGTNARNYIYDIVNFDTHWLKINSIINNINRNEN